MLNEGSRALIDAKEWRWIEQHMHGDFDHLLLGTSLPVLLAPGAQYRSTVNHNH
jgi:hypothetical protein